MFDGNGHLGIMIEKMLLAVLVSLFLLCAGIGLVVLVYLWLVWYASLHGFTEGRPPLDKSPKQGLSEADLQKLPTIECRKGEEGLANMECAVCLDSFQSGERCRLIPTCKHSFHVQCADAWLSKRSVCPICRTSACETQQDTEHLTDGSAPFPSGTSATAFSNNSSDTVADFSISIRPPDQTATVAEHVQ
eukprot:Gb_35824 [translate_table: standard]